MRILGGGHAKQGNLEFRRELAWEMIYNPEVPVEEEYHQAKERSCKKMKLGHCELMTLRKKCAFYGHEPTKCVTTTAQYNRRKCVCGKARTRTYCICSPVVHKWPECYADRRIEVAMATNR
jgi:hypothetical protein